MFQESFPPFSSFAPPLFFSRLSGKLQNFPIFSFLVVFVFSKDSVLFNASFSGVDGVVEIRHCECKPAPSPFLPVPQPVPPPRKGVIARSTKCEFPPPPNNHSP